MSGPTLTPLGVDADAYEPVLAKQHESASWQRFSGYRFATGRGAVPIAASEVESCAVEFPLIIEREGGSYRLLSLFAIDRMTNLFVTREGRWRGAYIPAALRAYPFSAISRNGSSTLAIEQAAVDRAGEYGDEAFFVDGRLTELLTQVAEFIARLDQGVRELSEHLSDLAHLAVLEPLDRPDIAALSENPTLMVSDSALRALPATDLRNLAQSGALNVAYAQSLSMHNLQYLRRLDRSAARPAAATNRRAESASSTNPPDDEFLLAVRQDYERNT
ncbi:SapC family protein [Spiribacter roseus]|uniref:SapC family protein n=1 Tax=Spiribacter roseus TaxID=1855875 RepID=A0ABV3RZA8_9GAMM